MAEFAITEFVPMLSLPAPVLAVVVTGADSVGPPPCVIVSVAVTLPGACQYVVGLLDVEVMLITAPLLVAVIPAAERSVSAFIRFLRPVAIVVVVSVPKTV
jgi:hypothetical protein